MPYSVILPDGTAVPTEEKQLSPQELIPEAQPAIQNLLAQEKQQAPEKELIPEQPKPENPSRFRIILPSGAEIAPEESAAATEESVAAPEESTGKAILRHGTRTASRVAEAVSGLPGDLVQLAGSIANLGIKAAGGKGYEALSDIPYVPTSSKIREYITKPIVEKVAGKGYIDPKSSKEELSDDIVGDLSVLLLPIKGKLPFGRALAGAGLGNLAKWGAKKLGLPEYAQEGVKLGTMLGVNFAGAKKIDKIASNLFEDAKKALPAGAKVSSKPFMPVLKKLDKLVAKGDLPTNWAKKTEFLKKSIKKGKVPVQDIWDLERDMNNIFYGQAKPSAFKRSFNDMKDGLKNTMKEYGKKNPKFIDSYTDANSIYSAIKKSNVVTDAVSKYTSKKNLTAATVGSLLGWYSPATLLKTVGAAKASGLITKTFGVFKRSPAARKYYMKTVEQALLSNGKVSTHFAKKLDEVMRKEIDNN